jgi:putative restriction endonuclease
MDDADRDTLMRMAAFAHLRRLGEVHDHLTATELKPGFMFDGERIPLINRQRGIFKPQQMQFLLSIKTVFPKPGGKIWYDDQREVHRQIFEGDETIDYAFMGRDPDAADNRWLREASENRIPIVYFLGIAPGRYQAMLPAFITGWDGKALKARVAFGAPGQQTLAPPETALERRCALRAVKQRLHQASFREAVISAYNGRCALSGLPEPLLLDAAHIVADKDEQFGQPVVPNGIPLSKIHHAAFDAHLIGIDPDYRLHASERLLGRNDGPMLEALKRIKRRDHPPAGSRQGPPGSGPTCAALREVQGRGVRCLHSLSRRRRLRNERYGREPCRILPRGQPRLSFTHAVESTLGNATRPQKDCCWLGTTTAIDPCRVARHTGNVQDASLD